MPADRDPRNDPGPVTSCYRVLRPGRQPDYFHTETGARTAAALADKGGRHDAPILEYRDPADRGDPDAWVPLSAGTISAANIPDPGAMTPAMQAAAAAASTRMAKRAAQKRQAKEARP